MEKEATISSSIQKNVRLPGPPKEVEKVWEDFKVVSIREGLSFGNNLLRVMKKHVEDFRRQQIKEGRQ